MSDTEHHFGVLMIDIAGSSRLRAERGDAAASQQIVPLLDQLARLARSRGASFVKPGGDDLLITFPQSDGGNRAAGLAIEAQQVAAQAGLRLYAGVHVGQVEFRLTDGRPDAYGQAIHLCARLHKLIEDAPGQIFVTEDTLRRLRPELQAAAVRFGSRLLRNIGSYEIWTLPWQPAAQPAQTLFLASPGADGGGPLLLTASGGRSVRLAADGRRHLIGRGPDCELQVIDPERRVSSAHVAFECLDGRWLVQDLSRNGSWLQQPGDPGATLLPYNQKLLAPPAGTLTLGRPPAEDPDRRYGIRFEQLPPE